MAIKVMTRHYSSRQQQAFTLVEILITLVVIGALAAIAIPSYQSYLERNKRSPAIKDIAELSMAIERFNTENGAYPANLAALGAGLPVTDPWGNAYQYLGIDVTPAPHTGQVRRDKNMNPLNSDFDLYSMGPDGQTAKQLTAAKARDDIVRAGNGGFIGLAAEH
jgi:general secretion pathway protein G